MPAIRRLKTAQDVRSALATLYRKLEADEIDPQKARVMVYVAATIASIIKDESMERLEERLAALEAEKEDPRRRRTA